MIRFSKSPFGTSVYIFTYVIKVQIAISAFVCAGLIYGGCKCMWMVLIMIPGSGTGS